MISAEEFVSSCSSRGFSFFTGVPCSLLKPLINYVIKSPNLDYVIASSEGEAIGIAAGVYLAGKRSVVMCQNSGLGNMVNPLTSLNYPFRIPVLLIVTQRGEPSIGDEPQHELMGEITTELLDALRIPWSFFPESSEMITTALDEAENAMSSTGLPFALVMRKGSMEKTEMDAGKNRILSEKSGKCEGSFVCGSSERMRRIDAIQIIQEMISAEDAIIATTGKIGRELFTLRDRENQIYIVGSMGCASSIGFGIQHVLPERRVVVLDGDGAALMKMGTFATIGHYQPPKLMHIILDNEAHESTGGQFTASTTVDFCGVALACGYRQCYRVEMGADLQRAISSAKGSIGPSLIHLKVACGSIADLGRPTIKPYQVKERFMRFLGRGAVNA